MKKIYLGMLLGIFMPLAVNAANISPDNNAKSSATTSPYYSSPASHSVKMNTYIKFILAAEAGDQKTVNQLVTDDIVWDFDSGSEVANGLPWIGLYKGKKEISHALQGMKGMIHVLSRDYYLISENKTRLIVVAKDNVKLLGNINLIVPNVNFANVITFSNGKISYIKTVEDNARMLKAYQTANA